MATLSKICAIDCRAYVAEQGMNVSILSDYQKHLHFLGRTTLFWLLKKIASEILNFQGGLPLLVCSYAYASTHFRKHLAEQGPNLQNLSEIYKLL